MSITLASTDYINDALTDLGVLLIGQSANSDLLNAGLRSLNQMLEQWLLQQFLLPGCNPRVYTLTGGQQIYTIGPNGANLTDERPTRIDEANIILNTVNPVVRQPLRIIDEDRWAAIRVQQIPFAIPLELWYPRDFDPVLGFGTIYLWPGPLSSYQLELFTWNQISQFADLTTQYTFPPGYSEFIRKSLALKLYPQMRAYFKVPIDPEVLGEIKSEREAARDTIEQYNLKTPVLKGDPAFTGSRRGGWNYAIGDYNT